MSHLSVPVPVHMPCRPRRLLPAGRSADSLPPLQYVLLIPVYLWRITSKRSWSTALIRPGIFIVSRIAAMILRVIQATGNTSLGLFSQLCSIVSCKSRRVSHVSILTPLCLRRPLVAELVILTVGVRAGVLSIWPPFVACLPGLTLASPVRLPRRPARLRPQELRRAHRPSGPS